LGRVGFFWEGQRGLGGVLDFFSIKVAKCKLYDGGGYGFWKKTYIAFPPLVWCMFVCFVLFFFLLFWVLWAWDDDIPDHQIRYNMLSECAPLIHPSLPIWMGVRRNNSARTK
jgi:hypothetical protein